MVAALEALQEAAMALPGVRNAEAIAKVLSLAKLDDIDRPSTSKVFCPASVPNECTPMGDTSAVCRIN